MRHRIAGVIFLLLGIYFLIPDLMPPSMEHAGHDMPTHGNSLLGIGEMTWMWFTMAVVHFFIRDCGCNR